MINSGEEWVINSCLPQHARNSHFMNYNPGAIALKYFHGDFNNWMTYLSLQMSSDVVFHEE